MLQGHQFQNKFSLYSSCRIDPATRVSKTATLKLEENNCVKYPYSTQALNPTNCHELTNIWIRGWIVLSLWRSWLIRTVRSQLLQFIGLSDIWLKSFELFKTLATNSPIRKIVRDSYQIPKAFLDIVIDSEAFLCVRSYS